MRDEAKTKEEMTVKVLVQTAESSVYIYTAEEGEKFKHAATSSTFKRVRFLNKNTPFGESNTVVEAKDFTVGRVHKKAGLLMLMKKYFPEYDGAEVYSRYTNSDPIGVVGDVIEEEPTKRAGTGEAKEQKFKVGSILSSSWGYDQTNVDFYKVVKRTKKSLWLIEIGSSSVEGSEGFMSDKVVPNPEAETGEVFMKRIYIANGEEQSVAIKSYASATLYEGTPKYRSWYA